MKYPYKTFRTEKQKHKFIKWYLTHIRTNALPGQITRYIQRENIPWTITPRKMTNILRAGKEYGMDTTFKKPRFYLKGAEYEGNKDS